MRDADKEQAMTDRLLKEDDVIRALHEQRGLFRSDKDAQRFAVIVEDIPAADRPQGEWKHLKGDEWLCSNCGHVVWTEGSWEHPLERGKDYCEHCGAQMKGEQDE